MIEKSLRGKNRRQHKMKRLVRMRTLKSLMCPSLRGSKSTARRSGLTISSNSRSCLELSMLSSTTSSLCGSKRCLLKTKVTELLNEKWEFRRKSMSRNAEQTESKIKVNLKV